MYLADNKNVPFAETLSLRNAICANHQVGDFNFLPNLSKRQRRCRNLSINSQISEYVIIGNLPGVFNLGTVSGIIQIDPSLCDC